MMFKISVYLKLTPKVISRWTPIPAGHHFINGCNSAAHYPLIGFILTIFILILEHLYQVKQRLK